MPKRRNNSMENLLKNTIVPKKSKWSQEENDIFLNYIARNIIRSGEVDWDELKTLLPMKTKAQLYSKHQKMKKLVRFNNIPKYAPVVTKKKELLNKQLLSSLSKIENEEVKYINFICSENGDLLPIEVNFLKMLITMSKTESNTIIANLDETVFENIFTHLSMDKLYSNFLEKNQ